MVTEKISFRNATIADLDEMKKLYVDTIQSVCSADYTTDQRNAWAASVTKTERWLDIIETQFAVLALADKKITGFATLKDGNYIDFFYVHKEHQKQGIAKLLLTQLENRAKQLGISVITSDISKTARPFFEKNGFTVLAEQRNIRQGQELINYKMTKSYP